MWQKDNTSHGGSMDERSRETTEGGEVRFGVGVGSYRLCEAPGGGWQQTLFPLVQCCPIENQWKPICI